MRFLVHAEARRRGGREVVDDAMKTFLQGGGSEIYEESDRLPGEAKVGEELLFVNRMECLDGF